MRVMKCKFCDNRFDNADQFVSHLESNHADMIPQDMTSYQFFYYLKTGKDYGKCVTCGGTHKRWNTKTNKYYRFCSNKKCEEKSIIIFHGSDSHGLASVCDVKYYKNILEK